MKALITGAAGFVGPYMADVLLRNGFECTGFARPTDTGFDRLPKQVTIFYGDIRDKESVSSCLQKHRPDLIVHLAAITSIPFSFEQPATLFDVNVNGTLNLLECVRRSSLKPRILNVSTSLIYGTVTPGIAGFKESDAWLPNSPYATSKAMCELACTTYYRNFGIEILTARPFNHIGPGQSPDFVCSDFARQIALIISGKRENTISVGNLEPVRDFTDVRDIAQAYYRLICTGRPGEVYNVCSGQLHSIAEALEALIQLSGLQITVRCERSRLRPNDVLRSAGDASKLERETGWHARIPFFQTLRELLDYWIGLTNTNPERSLVLKVPWKQ